MYDRFDDIPEHEMDSAMSAYGPQGGQDRVDYEYELMQRIQLQRDMERDQFLERGPFASAAAPEVDYDQGVDEPRSYRPYVAPELTPLQKRQRELEAEALERGRKQMREDRARREHEDRARAEKAQAVRRAADLDEEYRPTAPLPTASPLKTIATWILWLLAGVVALAILSNIL
ncbi:hypothetical protein [Streptomyces brasiliscabiei]|uniref:hypothetical protein n=1 Tax=Streptomyces brasiliscabiei TaxID=2736302 RepID=UPI001C0FB322|nr:hypothetical protein [Streptomyces brasiliscabiei]